MKHYLRDRLFIAFLLIFFIIVFATLSALFSLPLTAVVYASILSLVLLLIFSITDFTRYLRLHKTLMRLVDTPLNNLYSLPEPTNLIHHDYTQVFHHAFQRQSEFTAQAENMQRMQAEYYSLWTHQIKVPISAMRLLLHANSSKKDAQLNAELFKIEQYVDMALSYVRLQGTETDYLIKTYSLDSIVRQAVRKFAPLFIQKKLAVDYQETTLQVLTDEKWLVFALEQVLSNAIKYSRHGCITIWADDALTTLYIKDQGIGIAPQDLPRIFEHGYTGYNGRSDKRATGLGLYLCKNILTKLSHTIDITSTLSEGTLVAINLHHLDFHPE